MRPLNLRPRMWYFATWPNINHLPKIKYVCFIRILGFLLCVSLICNVSVNHKLLISIAGVYWKVITLHVSVILTNIRRFINNTLCHHSLANCFTQWISRYWSRHTKLQPIYIDTHVLSNTTALITNEKTNTPRNLPENIVNKKRPCKIARTHQ
jgi:hypothetical protein